MKYLEAVTLLKCIEAKYDVMSIQYGGISVWPFLRLKILDNISVSKEVKISKSVIKVVLKSLLYGFLNVFGKYDLWTFTSAERRKLVGEKFIHRISGSIVGIPYKSLMIEKPSIFSGHYSKQYIEEFNILSEAGLLILSKTFSSISSIKRSDMQNYMLMERILEENNLHFDYIHYVRQLVGQYKSMNLMLRFVNKPKLVLFECPYDSMGYVWSFHDHGIKTIELQHGVLNQYHNAYNAKCYELKLNPDAICVYGIEEYNYFTDVARNYAPDVYMTGLYMLEMAENYFINDIFGEYRKEYKQIVVVSGQAGFEEQLGQFINKVTIQHSDTLFVYIPRHDNVKLSFDSNNILIKTNVNIYEYLKWSDVHITISSTTCLEAHYFHKPTIFYDYQKMASSYYGSVLKRENAVEYVEDPNSFTKAFYNLLEGDFKYKDIFTHGHSEKLYNVIKNNI